MLIKTSFPWYTTLTIKDIFLSLLGRIFELGSVASFVLGAPLKDNTIFSLTVAVAFVIGVYLTNRSLHRLFSVLYPTLNGFMKIITYLGALIFPVPILEIVFIFENDAETEMIVPSFFQPNDDGRLSLLHSFIVFKNGILEADAREITKIIRKRYYASTSNEEGECAISIATNKYDFLCLIQGCSIYMFSEVDPKQSFSVIPAGWRFEESQDKTSAAIVFEKRMTILELNNSKYIAGIIVAAIDEMTKY